MTAPNDAVRSEKLARNSLAGIGATAVYLVSRLFLTPYVLLYLSLEEFGLWSMCFVILSYASIGAFGINTTYIRYTAKYHAAGKPEEISGLLSTGIICMTGFCSLFFLILFSTLPFILNLFDVAPDLRHLAGFMILGTAVIFGVDLTLGGFRAVLEGVQEIALAKKIFTLASLVEIAAILLFLYFGFGVKGMLYAYIIRVLLETLSCISRACRFVPSLRLSPRLLGKKHFRHLFVFGGKVQVLGGLAIFLSSLDRLVISSILGLSFAGIFEIARKFPFTGKSISGAAFGPFLPAAAHLGGSWEKDEIRPRKHRAQTYLFLVLWAVCIACIPLPLLFSDLFSHPLMAPATTLLLILLSLGGGYALMGHFAAHDRLKAGPLRDLFLNGARHINIANYILFCFLMAVARPLILAWAGPGYEEAAPVMAVLALAYMIHQCTGPATLIFRGIDRTGRELEYLILQLIFAGIWIPAATQRAGLTGTAWAILASTALASFFLFWRTNHVFHISMKTFFPRAVAPGAIPAVAAGILYFSLSALGTQNRMTSVAVVLTSGILYLGTVLPLTWNYVLNSGERDAIRAMLPRSKKNTH